MNKVLLISILPAIIAIPVWAARTPNPRRGLKRALLWFFLFNCCYLAFLRLVIPRVG
jgi:hypothetical protein